MKSFAKQDDLSPTTHVGTSLVSGQIAVHIQASPAHSELAFVFPAFFSLA